MLKKRILAGIVSILMLCCICTFPAAADTAQTVTVVYTNDIHGYYKQILSSSGTASTVGFELLAQYAQQADLLLDAGDTLHGQSFATVSGGASIAALMQSLQYDAMTPGNHDWSYGNAALKTLGQTYDLPMLAANVVTQDGSLLLQDAIIKQVGTLKIGVFGVSDPALYRSTAPQNMEGITFTDDIAAANHTAAALRDAGCDVVLCLTHHTDPGAFAAQLSGVDALVTGHEHQIYDFTVSGADGRPIYIAQSGYYFANIGRLTLQVENGQVTVFGEVISASQAQAEYAPDAQTAALIADLEAQQQPILSQPIGQNRETLPYSWEEIRTAERPLGRFVTGAYLYQTGADVAAENAGGIRAALPGGQVCYQDLIGISPYGNYIVVKQLTGAQLLKVLETSIEIGIQCDTIYTLQKQAVENGEDPYAYSWPDNSGSYLQFGGLSVVYDPSAPAGQRVLSVSVGGDPLDPEKNYSFATNNYVASSDNYPEIANAPTLYEYGTCEQALKLFVQAGPQVMDPIIQTPCLTAQTTPPTQPDTTGQTQTTTAAETVPSTVTPDTDGGQTPHTPDTGSLPVAASAAIPLTLCAGAALLACRRRHLANDRRTNTCNRR